jgi:uncharacterized pyridoxal phosphate-containing UPF0001 family protein
MTIGSPNPSPDQSDFRMLSELRAQICNKFGFDTTALELSMGMSNDFETAVSD